MDGAATARPAVALGELAAELDARRFVGRSEVLQLVGAALDGTSHVRVVHLHGPGGVGKSALLRALARQAETRGRTVVRVDGRLVATVPDALALALKPAAVADGPVLLAIDEVEQLEPLRYELRRFLLEDLPGDAVVVLAGRPAPGAEWRDGVLDQVSRTVAVQPLDVEESADLLARHGVRPGGYAAELTAWAHGFPLALTLAATLAANRGPDGPPPSPTDAAAPGEHLDDLLLARLGGEELRGVDPDVLDVACIAPAIDARLLAAVLPGRSTRQALAELRSCSLAEPLGQRTTLHRLARAALRARLRATDPDRYRTLVLRIAEVLRSRAATGGIGAMGEIAALVEDPQVLLGFGPSHSHYADRVRPADLEELAARTGRGEQAWFGRLRRWCEEAPAQVVVVRRVTGELAAFAVAFPPERAPAWALEHVEVGPVLAHARAAGQLEGASFLQDVTIVDRPDDPAVAAEVVRVGNEGVLRLAGFTAPPRCAFATSEVPEGEGPVLFPGFVEVPGLRRYDGERHLATQVIDYGPAGFAGQIHNVIRAEQRADPEPEAHAPTWLLPVLRGFHDDAALAAVDGRSAEELRAALRARLDEAFGGSETDQQLRRALERSYLDPNGGHGVAQRELFMSRASFYRFLQRAREQLVSTRSP